MTPILHYPKARWESVGSLFRRLPTWKRCLTESPWRTSQSLKRLTRLRRFSWQCISWWRKNRVLIGRKSPAHFKTTFSKNTSRKKNGFTQFGRRRSEEHTSELQSRRDL